MWRVLPPLKGIGFIGRDNIVAIHGSSVEDTWLHKEKKERYRQHTNSVIWDEETCGKPRERFLSSLVFKGSEDGVKKQEVP